MAARKSDADESRPGEREVFGVLMGTSGLRVSFGSQPNLDPHHLPTSHAQQGNVPVVHLVRFRPGTSSLNTHQLPRLSLPSNPPRRPRGMEVVQLIAGLVSMQARCSSAQRRGAAILSSTLQCHLLGGVQ